MRGTGVIVFRLNNGHHNHFEHATINAAKAEAHRLAAEIGGSYVVYAPVALIEETPPTQEKSVAIPGVSVDPDFDLPF